MKSAQASPAPSSAPAGASPTTSPAAASSTPAYTPVPDAGQTSFAPDVPMKKSSPWKMILFAFGFVMLLGGMVAALHLSQQSQEIRQQASVENCGGRAVACATFNCPNGDTNGDGQCTTADEGANNPGMSSGTGCGAPSSGCGQTDLYTREGDWGSWCGTTFHDFSNCSGGGGGGGEGGEEPKPPRCEGLTSDNEFPKLGDQVTFTCEKVKDAKRYDFRIAYFDTKETGKPEDFIKLDPEDKRSNVSKTYTVDKIGRYIAQCRPCVGNDLCADWEPVKGSKGEKPPIPPDPTTWRCEENVRDNFDGNTLKSDLWVSSSGFAPSNGKLSVTNTASNSAAFVSRGISSVKTVTGDYQLDLDFSNLTFSGPAGASGNTYFQNFIDDNNTFSVRWRYKSATKNELYVFRKVNGQETSGTALEIGAGKKPQLRIIRKGDKIQVKYNIGAGYKNLNGGEFTFTSAPVKVFAGASVKSVGTQPSTLSFKADDYRLKCP